MSSVTFSFNSEGIAEPVFTAVDVLRHGQCEGGNIFRGHTDVPLTQEGLGLMHAQCNALQASWDVVITSPLLRCVQFSQELSNNTGLQMEQAPALKEMNFGQWDGQPIDEIWQKHTKSIQLWSDKPASFTPPGGESLQSVSDRVEAFLAQLLNAHKGKKILLVTHGGVIRVLLNVCLGMPLNNANRWDVPYGCVSRLSYSEYKNHSRWQLVAHNVR